MSTPGTSAERTTQNPVIRSLLVVLIGAGIPGLTAWAFKTSQDVAELRAAIGNTQSERSARLEQRIDDVNRRVAELEREGGSVPMSNTTRQRFEQNETRVRELVEEVRECCPRRRAKLRTDPLKPKLGG